MLRPAFSMSFRIWRPAFDFGREVNGRECEPLERSKGSNWPQTKGKVTLDRIPPTVKLGKKKWA